MLDDGDQKLSAQEVVQGVAKLKGGARSIDLMALKCRCESIDTTCRKIEKNLKSSGLMDWQGSPPQSKARCLQRAHLQTERSLLYPLDALTNQSGAEVPGHIRRAQAGSWNLTFR